MNVTITGITGFHNRGVESLVLTKIEQMSIRNPDWTFTVLTSTPDYDSQRFQSPHVRFVIDAFRTLPGQVIQKLQPIKFILKKGGAGLNSAIEKYDSALKAIREASIVVASGGDVFSDIYSAWKTGRINPHLTPLKIAQHHNIPVIFMAQSIGPFTTIQSTKDWLKVAHKSPLITVRESVSFKYLSEKLGVPRERLYLTADPAFLLESSPSDAVRKMLDFYGIDVGRPVVALAASQGISLFSGLQATEHLKAWCFTVQTLLENTDAQFLLIPHVQDLTVNNDRIIATNLLRHFDYNPRIKLAGGDHTASEYKGLIGASSLVIAERMHAAIAGLSSGVCTIPIAYSPKAYGIMKDLLGVDMAKELTIPAESFLNKSITKKIVIQGWKRRNEISIYLFKKLPQAKERAADNFILLDDLLS